MVSACVSHRSSATGPDTLEVTGRTCRCRFGARSTTPSPSSTSYNRTRQRLGALATTNGETGRRGAQPGAGIAGNTASGQSGSCLTSDGCDKPVIPFAPLDGCSKLTGRLLPALRGHRATAHIAVENGGVDN